MGETRHVKDIVTDSTGKLSCTDNDVTLSSALDTVAICVLVRLAKPPAIHSLELLTRKFYQNKVQWKSQMMNKLTNCWQ